MEGVVVRVAGVEDLPFTGTKMGEGQSVLGKAAVQLPLEPKRRMTRVFSLDRPTALKAAVAPPSS